jgi:hypothetical protein
MSEQKIFTKDELIAALREIRERGWIPNARPGNSGGVGNTIEDILGITENNLPLPNSGEWELKAQRLKGTRSAVVVEPTADTPVRVGALTTLLHSEPSPRTLRFVPSILLPLYGWTHQKAGTKYPATEKSFRQTITGSRRSDRGFTVVVNRELQRIEISFDAAQVSARHESWLKSVETRIGLGELNPQPYWGFDDLNAALRAKLLNCFHLYARTRRVKGVEEFSYERIVMLQGFNFENFLLGIEQGWVFVDFDARTGHNHGTKFRISQSKLESLYGTVTVI